MFYPLNNPAALLDRIAALEANALAAGPNVDQIITGGRLINLPLATPGAPTVSSTPTTGATTQTYAVVAVLGTGTTPAGATGSTTVGPATLSVSAFNLISWTAVPGAVSYNVYRTVGGATQGLIANIPAPLVSVLDTGLVGDGTTAPSIGTTNIWAGVHGEHSVAYPTTGAAPISAFGTGWITATGVAALTIPAPISGAISKGGHDGLTLTLIDTTGHAHTVTGPANCFNGATHIGTFGGTKGQFGTLKAYQGVFYVTASAGFTLS